MEIIHKNPQDLKPYKNNARTHSDVQVQQIVESIKEFGFTNPILIDKKNGIIAGHGRVMAAQKMGIDSVPTIELSQLTETQKRAYILADNQLALNAGWDDSLLRKELEDLEKLEFDISIIGFDDIFSNTDQQSEESILDEKYTKKTDVFTYEPSGEAPDFMALFDDSKTKQLINDINNSNITPEEKEFLRIAAYRHCVFNFQEIANFYAHSEKETQKLMEDNALVIIDYDDAIAGGFVMLTKELQALQDE